MSRDLAHYARSGAWSLIAHAMQIVGAIAVSIVVVRAFSTVEIGVLGLARQITTSVVVVSGLALERVYLRFAPELVQGGNVESAGRLLRQTLVLRLFAWSPFVVLAFLLQRQIDALFGTGVGAATLVGVFTGVAYSLFTQLRAGATARFATAAVAQGTLATSVVTLIATLVAIEGGHGVDGVLIAAGIGMLAGCVPMVRPAFDRRTRGALEDSDGATATSADLSIRHVRFRRYALPFAAIAVLNHAVHSQTEVFFLGIWHGPEAAGFFHHGFTFAQRLVDFLPLALWEVSMAGFSRLVSRAPEGLGMAVRNYLVLLYLVMGPLAMLGVTFTPAATALLYGEKMLPAVPVAQAYFAVAAVAAVGAPFGMILYARERVSRALGAYVVFAVVNLGLDLALIPSLGITGAILGLSAAKLVAVVLMGRLALREVGRIDLPWAFLGRVTLASCTALAWIPAVGPDAAWTTFFAVFGAAVLTLVVAFRIMRVIGVDEAVLVRRTRLPLVGVLLRLVGPRREVLS